MKPSDFLRPLRCAVVCIVLGGIVAVAAASAPAASGPFSNPVAPVADPRLQIPATIRPLLDVWMRDTYVADGGDGYYYLTGTTAAPGRNHCWDWNDGLHLWRSKDLKAWEHLGLIWSLDRDATWQRAFGKAEPGRTAPSGDIMDDKRRAVWAPEIHYIRSKRQWLIVACMNDGTPQKGSFILRSTSGKPEGPYENIAGNASGPIFPNIDGGLFEDDDGVVYFVGHNHFIARMKDDLSGLAEPVRQFAETPYDPEPYAEGAYVVKHAVVGPYCSAALRLSTSPGTASMPRARKVRRSQSRHFSPHARCSPAYAKQASSTTPVPAMYARATSANPPTQSPPRLHDSTSCSLRSKSSPARPCWIRNADSKAAVAPKAQHDPQPPWFRMPVT